MMSPLIMKIIVLLQALTIAAVPWNGRRQGGLEHALAAFNISSHGVVPPILPPLSLPDFLPPVPISPLISGQIPNGSRKRRSATSSFPSTNSIIPNDLNISRLPHIPLLPPIMRRNLNETDGNSTSLPTTPLSSNIFAHPIATSPPLSAISSRPDHPVPRLGIQPQDTPLNTNKFYANLFLGSQTAGTFTHPYQVSWVKGSGMGISHVDLNQRAWGPNPTAVPCEYFVNPIGMQSMILSAAELSNSSTLTTSNLTSFSAIAHLSPTSGSAPAISFPFVQGMGFVTGIFNGATPLIQSSIGIFSMTRAQSNPKVGVAKYTFITQDQKKWLLYAYSPSGEVPKFTLSGGSARAASGFKGTIQIAKDPGGAEALYDAYCGAYPTDASVSGAVSDSVGSYSLSWTKAGIPSPLLMWALPHHVQSFSSEMKKSMPTGNNLSTSVQMITTTKGMATAVIGDKWDMVEPKLPVDMGFAPWSPANGTVKKLSASAIKTILPIAQAEIKENMTMQVDVGSMYYSGKALAKFAGIVYTLNDLLDDPVTAKAGLTALKVQFAQFVNNVQSFPLVHETAWGGIVSSGSYTTGDAGVDFGNTYYNDHHFHYGYFIYAGAIIAHLDPGWLLENNGANKDYVDLLVRDIANPSPLDTLFPQYRMFDWYHGHSWAHGLYETFDGKDQESSSEDSMSAYALKMWGQATHNADMEARGNLQLAITARSLQHYFLYDDSNKVQPTNFIGNRVSGILFENKIDHTTYFGNNISFIQGIHMLPLLPHSTLTRTQNFVRDEWKTWFSDGKAEQYTGGWKGVLYANLAIIDPVAAWKFFCPEDFDDSLLDGGASRTWYMAWIAGMGGA